MVEKAMIFSARLSLIISAIIAVLCFGALVRVELLLREHRTLIEKIQDKTDCIKSCKLKDRGTKGKENMNIMEKKFSHTRCILLYNRTTVNPRNDH